MNLKTINHKLRCSKTNVVPEIEFCLMECLLADLAYKPKCKIKKKNIYKLAVHIIFIAIYICKVIVKHEQT